MKIAKLACKLSCLVGGLWGLYSIVITLMAVLIYSRLTVEEPIASVYFEKEDEGWRAYLSGEEDGIQREYVVYGEQWRIDVEFIKMKPWANVLGIDPRYHLDRFQGRYRNVEDENHLPHKAYDLAYDDFLSIPNALMSYNIFIDAEYGSSAYKDIDIGKLYTVYRTQSGVIVRETVLPSGEGTSKNPLQARWRR